MSSVVRHPRQVFDLFMRSRFARNVATVATGTAAAQGLNMAFAPLITRIYGPEAFGLLGTFLAIVAIATPVSALAYPMAIVLPRADRDALGLVCISIFLSITVAIIATAALWLGGDWLAEKLGAGAVAGYMLLIPLAMLFSAWMQIGEHWLIRKGEFGMIARIAVAQSLIINSAKTVIGWFNPIATVLIVLSTLGPALQAALLFSRARHQYVSAGDVERKSLGTSIGHLAHRHRDFPLYRAPQNLLNAASQGLPVLLLAALSGPVAAGFYTLGKTVLGVPSAFVGKAVRDVFYPRLVEAAHRDENLAGLIFKATGGLLAIGLLPFGFVVMFGPWLFGLVFGHEWIVAGEYARWIALWSLFAFINAPSVAGIPVLKRQAWLLTYEVGSVVFRVAALVAGFFLFSSEIAAVALFSLAGMILNSYLILATLNFARAQNASMRAVP